jgi:Heterokaryon incompatibility protein (HET)
VDIKSLHEINTVITVQLLWDMPMASPQSWYSPLDSKSSQIRVVHLRPSQNFDERLIASLEVVSLKNCPIYSALSYTWGTDAALSPILLDGSDFYILANLELALKHLRDADIVRVLWIDLICIDQSNKKEKEDQIPLMKEIYSTASLVLVWLGESDPTIDECAHQITSPYTQLEDEDQTINRLLSYREIARKPWWFRIWTIQEFIMARDDPIFLCGRHKWSWSQLRSHVLDNFQNCHNKMSNEELSSRINRLSTDPDLENMMIGYAQMSTLNDLKNEYDADGSLPLQSTLIRTLRRKATVHHDRIYGLLALLNDDERSRIKIDYDVPLNRMSLDIMMAFWSNGKILHLMSSFGFYNREQQGDLPSWVISFSKGFPPALSFVPYKQFPDIWKQSIKLKSPVERNGRLILQWPGRLVDDIMSCHHISGASKIDPQTLVASLCSIRNDVEASSRYSDPKLEIFTLAMTDVFGERQNFTAVLTNKPASSQLDARIRRYIDMEWFIDIATAVNPHTTSGDALARGFSRIREIPNFEQTWSDMWDFIRSFIKYAIELRFFTTTQGYIGVTSENIELGNCIALLEGFEIPIVLQRTGYGAFKIIGFSYIPSLMVPSGLEGFLQPKGFKDQIFDIH